MIKINYILLFSGNPVPLLIILGIVVIASIIAKMRGDDPNIEKFYANPWSFIPHDFFERNSEENQCDGCLKIKEEKLTEKATYLQMTIDFEAKQKFLAQETKTTWAYIGTPKLYYLCNSCIKGHKFTASGMFDYSELEVCLLQKDLEKRELLSKPSLRKTIGFSPKDNDSLMKLRHESIGNPEIKQPLNWGGKGSTDEYDYSKFR